MRREDPTPRPAARALAGALLALAAPAGRAAAQEGAPPERPRGVLLIAIDALRADHLSVLGYDRETTPNLDALAAEGTLFAEAYAAAPLPIPAHVALLTGCEPLLARRVLPDGTGTPEQRWSIPDALPRLAVEFLAAGYRTGAFVADRSLQPALGFAPGFQEFLLAARAERGAETLAERMLGWVRGLPRDARWFALLHLGDLERCWFEPDLAREEFFAPREELDFVPPVGSTNDVFFAIPNERWRGGSRTLGHYEAIYDGHLRRLDEDLGHLLGSLRSARLMDDTVVCVVGTYGVQFGEAGLYLCSGRYSMADLHVPWIVRAPGATPAELAPEQGRVDALASLLDVAPTLVELAGLPPPTGMQGLSQARYVRGAGGGRPPTGTTRLHAFASCGLQEGVAIVAWPRHALEFLVPDRTLHADMRRSWSGEDRLGEGRTTVRFYDRLEDPFPPLESPVPTPAPPEFEAMRERALTWLENVSQAQRVLQENLLFHERVDPETVRRLRDAGYLGQPIGER